MDLRRRTFGPFPTAEDWQKASKADIEQALAAEVVRRNPKLYAGYDEDALKFVRNTMGPTKWDLLLAAQSYGLAPQGTYLYPDERKKRHHVSRKYGPKASEKVAQTMHEFKRGTLKSGSGKKVTSRKQAIAIGLSQARRAGGKVPPAPRHHAAVSTSPSRSSPWGEVGTVSDVLPWRDSYANWTIRVGEAAARHNARIAFGSETYDAWKAGVSPDDYARAHGR